MKGDRTNLEGPGRAQPDELEGILVLANEVMRVGQGMKPTFATDYSFIYNRKNAENIMVVKDGDRFVSMVGMWMNTVEVGNARLRAGVSTFCIFVREFSPLEVCAGSTKKVLLGGFRERGDGRVEVNVIRRVFGDDDFH